MYGTKAHDRNRRCKESVVTIRRCLRSFLNVSKHHGYYKLPSDFYHWFTLYLSQEYLHVTYIIYEKTILVNNFCRYNSSGTTHGPLRIFSEPYANLENGHWSKPYFDCGGGDIWMVTFSAPIFGLDIANGKQTDIKFMWVYLENWIFLLETSAASYNVIWKKEKKFLHMLEQLLKREIVVFY